MKQWEYKTELFAPKNNLNIVDMDVVNRANEKFKELGLEGWELVSAFFYESIYFAVFKRPLN